MLYTKPFTFDNEAELESRVAGFGALALVLHCLPRVDFRVRATSMMPYSTSSIHLPPRKAGNFLPMIPVHPWVWLLWTIGKAHYRSRLSSRRRDTWWLPSDVN